MAVEIEGISKKIRTRSPAYPYLDLRSALDKAAVLFKAEGRHPAAVNVVMHHWGYKEDSSTGHSSMAALKKYGLIEHDGMGENKQIRLSNLALTILLDENPDSPGRTDALRTAAMSPRIHAELWERYGSDLPSDQSLKRYLVLEKSFNEAAVDELLAEYKQTIGFAGLNLVQVPVIAAGAFASAPAASAYPAPPPPPVSAGRPVATAPAAGPDDLPYDWHQEAAPATFQAPPRAIGPANGARRELDPSNGPERRQNGYDEGFGPQGDPRMNTGNERRRDQGGYRPNGGRQQIEREPSRYDQDDFGYDEDGYALPPRNGGASFAQPEVPAPVARFAPRAAAPAPSLPVTHAPNPAAALGLASASAAADGEAASGAARKELPVPLDGDRVALVPYPMTEEDFSLLIATLQLWKKRLVRGGE